MEENNNLNKITELIEETARELKPVYDVNDVKQIKDWVINFYKVIGYKKDILEKADKVMEKALNGWTNAPDSLLSRAKACIGFNTIRAYEKRVEFVNQKREEGYTDYEIAGELTRLKKRKKTVVNLERVNTEDVVFGDSLIDYLPEDEKIYWKQREKQYRDEFDFNQSSDRILLEEVLYTEVLLRRIRLSRLTGEEREDIRGLNEITLLDNHKKILEKLGVLRIQRIQEESNIEGNVSELSRVLEERLNEIGSLSNREAMYKTLKKIASKYTVITKEELEELAEEAMLIKEVEKLGHINPIPQAIYEQITMEMNRKAKEAGVSDE